MRLDRLPLTYDECRARFRRVVSGTVARHSSHPIDAGGPEGQELTIDIATLGAAEPETALVVLCGVHGVEGFIGSTLQTDLVSRIDPGALPPGTAVVLVHVVNPWGMAHDRRQNEHNVDLNRNWRRSDREPEHNLAYDELHAIACPDTASVPSADDLLRVVGPIVEERGVAWVTDGITRGQYRHPDGLHFGGDRTEQSCAVLEAEIPQLVGSAARVLTVDLHTGVGPYGTLTLLSSQPVGSPQDTFLRAAFGEVDATVGNPGSASSVKSGPIAAGLAEVLPRARHHAVTAEFGTADDIAQLRATYQEQWVHRHGDLDDPEHRAVRWTYRCCFTPDDPDWEQQTLSLGRQLLDDAVGTLDPAGPWKAGERSE